MTTTTFTLFNSIQAKTCFAMSKLARIAPPPVLFILRFQKPKNKRIIAFISNTQLVFIFLEQSKAKANE